MAKVSESELKWAKVSKVSKVTGIIQRFRAAGRAFASAGVGYEITQASRTRRAFGIISGLMASADRHQSKQTLGYLREFCRMHDRQSALFSGMLDRAADNIFGSDFDFVPGTGDKVFDKTIKEYITRRMEADLADATGERDFPDVAKTALRAIWNDGDCLLVKRPDGSLLPFEADQIESPSGGQMKDTRIVLGVELNDLNRHAAYYVKPRRSRGDTGMVGLDEQAVRIRKADTFFPAYRKRFNQTRGIPFVAAALATFDRTNNYLDYEQLAAEGNSMLGFQIQKEPTSVEMGGVADNTDTTTSGTFDKLQKMEPMQIFELAVGEKVEMIGANRPGSNFDAYMVLCCRIVGVALGMPLELVMLDFSRTNYSSARASLGEARRGFRAWQRFAQKRICLPWYGWQIARGIAAGEIWARPEAFKVRCQWPAWEYIDPYKEAMGNQVALKSRTKSISQCIREVGGEPDEVFEEIAADRKKLTALGVPIAEDNPVKPGGGEQENVGQEDQDDEDEKERRKQEKQNAVA